MVNLTRTIDRATGYIFVPAANDPQTNPAPPGATNTHRSGAQRPNSYALFSSAMGPMAGPGADVRDVQERWIDARDEYDAHEKREWRKEGEMAKRTQEAEIQK
jgi:hypothetical protein